MVFIFYKYAKPIIVKHDKKIIYQQLYKTYFSLQIRNYSTLNMRTG